MQVLIGVDPHKVDDLGHGRERGALPDQGPLRLLLRHGAA